MKHSSRLYVSRAGGINSPTFSSPKFCPIYDYCFFGIHHILPSTNISPQPTLTNNSHPAFFWSFWPGQTPVDAETMNWGVVMFVGVGFLCAVAYALQGRKIYAGPVKTVMGREHEL